ncbi:MFS general substrate transporter [Phellopilus nigrolimitatus]|nr:MFS general substrate transporter [Phellopilus nigrolimitatus]
MGLLASIGSLEDHELRELGHHRSAMMSQRNISSLAPTDTGFKAWSFLAGAFLVEAVVWAFPTSFGVLLNAYMRDYKLASQAGATELLPLIGTFSSGIIYCSGPIIYPFIHRYPHHKRTCLWVGLALCFTSLFGASYATKVRDLLILQGFLYAIGGSLLYAPCISFMSEWFVRRRGLANGVMFAGTAVGGLLLPLILPHLVNSFGPSKTLRILSLAILGLILPALPFLRPRLPESRVHGPDSRPEVDQGWRFAWIKNPPFMLYVLANTLQGFAYFLPLLWLPTFASDLNLSDTDASLTLALLNGSSVMSRVGMGVLSDKFNPWILALATTFCTSLATFVLWGVLSRGFPGLLAYGIFYGGLAGGWSSLFTGFVKPVAKDNPSLSTTLFGVLMLSRGIGNILSTPISTALSHMDASSTRNTTGSSPYSSHPSLGFNVADGRYAKMIFYVGTCFAGAGVIGLFGWGIEIARTRRRDRR